MVSQTAWLSAASPVSSELLPTLKKLLQLFFQSSPQPPSFGYDVGPFQLEQWYSLR